MERISRRKLIQTLVVIGGTTVTTLLAAEAVKAIDKAFKPKFVNRGNPAPPMDERPEWQRPTNWRIIFSDGRKNGDRPTP